MSVATDMDSTLFQILKLDDDPIWLPQKPWESVRSESGLSRSAAGLSPPRQRCLYDASTVSEPNLVRLAMNAMCGVQSALVTIEKLSAAFCSDPADRTFHRISSLWNRSLSTHILGKLLKSVGFSGSVVFLLRKFVDYFTNLNLNGNAFESPQVNPEVAENGSRSNRKTGKTECPKNSLVNQAFGVAMRKVLEGYLCALDTFYASVGFRYPLKRIDPSSYASSGVGCLRSVVHSDVTLLEVYLHTKELRTHIEAIGSVCKLHHVALLFSESSVADLVGKANSEFHNFPRGGDLLTYLYYQLQVADPSQCAVLKFLFLRSCEPYCGFIRSWIFKAEISDPYKEFVVEDINSPVIAVKERHGIVLPCFLKDILVPLLRSGQQLLAVKKLLEICKFVAIGDHNYEDILPCWSEFSSSQSSFASPLTFDKGNIEAMALARQSFYKKIQRKLENGFAKLIFRNPQVVRHDTLSIFSDCFRTPSPTVQGSFILDDNLLSISSLKFKKDSNMAVDTADREVTEVFSDVVEPLESSEFSSPVSSGEENESEQLMVPACLIWPDEKYFSALCLSPTISTNNLLLKATESKNSESMESTSKEVCNGTGPVGPLSYSHYRRIKLSHTSMPLESGKSNCSWTTESQHRDGQSNMYWPLGSLLKNPFHVDKGFEDDKRLLPSECVPIASNGTMGTSKESLSTFNKIKTAYNSLKEKSIKKEEPKIETTNSFIFSLWNLDFHNNFLSMNPMLSRNAFFQLPIKPVVGCESVRKENMAYFDFSSVQDPCKVYMEELNVNSQQHFEDEPQISAVAGISTTSSVHDFSDRRSFWDNVPSSGCKDHSIENAILPNIAEGTSWESLLTGFCGSGNHCNGNLRQSLVAKFEIPIDFIIDKCLLQEILLQYKYVSKLMIKLLEEGFDLHEHLVALRRYHLMEFADWANLFMTSLWHHKWLVMEADEKILQVQRILELSVKRSSCGMDHNKDRLFVYKNSKNRHDVMPLSISAIRVNSFDFIGLGYRVDWPISIVLTSGALKVYADIFNFLMQVKLALFSLTDLWSSLKDLMHLISQIHLSDLRECEMRHFNILVKMRHQVNHFVSTLHQYVQSQLSVSWLRFLHSLKHKVNDMMDIESVHGAYLNDALHICLLSDETRYAAEIIKNILQCALDFRSSLVGGIWEDGIIQRDLVGKSSRINMSQVLALQATFNKNLNELHLRYLKSSKHEEFGLSHFWGCLNYNEYYSGGISNYKDAYAFPM